MVVLNKIYTRTGDKGETALGDGTRVSKHALRVNAYGTVDEVNATFGLARLYASLESLDAIERIQNDLFDLGADLCRPIAEQEETLDHPPLRMTQNQVERLEVEIDEMTAQVQPLRSFILPGGSALAAHLHICRTVSRRAERLCTDLSQAEHVNFIAVSYLNRLSDWCFQAARIANNKGADDILWTPGANR